MNHNVFGRKLSRSSNERQRLLRMLAREILMHGGIKTTRAKAKAAQPLVETLVTKAKNGSNASLAQIRKVVSEKSVVDKFLSETKTRFAARTSGYTRIVPIGKRMGDNSDYVWFGFVDEVVVPEVVKSETEKEDKKQKKAKSTASKRKKNV